MVIYYTAAHLYTLLLSTNLLFIFILVCLIKVSFKMTFNQSSDSGRLHHYIRETLHLFSPVAHRQDLIPLTRFQLIAIHPPFPLSTPIHSGTVMTVFNLGKLGCPHGLVTLLQKHEATITTSVCNRYSSIL